MTPLSDQYKNAFHVEGPTVDAVIATLQSQLAASQERTKVLETLLEAEVHPENLAISAELEISLERERILREGLEVYANIEDWYSRTDFAEDGSILGETWEFYGRGPRIAEEYLKKAEEIK